MKKGDMITVYEDPYTRTKPEGKARLRVLHSGDPEGQRWYVRFEGESQDVLRLIVSDEAAR